MKPGRVVSNRSSRSAVPPKAPNEKPPPTYFPYVVMSAVAPSSAARPERPWRDVITSSAMQTAPSSRTAANIRVRNSGLAVMQPPAPSIGVDDHGGKLLVDQRNGRGEIVVGREHDVVGRVRRRQAAREREHATVVAALEDEHFRTAGRLDRRRDRHQIRLGAGVREAHALKAEPVAHRACERRLVRVNPADAPESAHRVVRRVEHPPLAVTEEPRRVVAEEVDVLVPVGVGEDGFLSTDECQRKGLVREHRAGVAAGEHLRRILVQPPTLWIALGEVSACLRNELRRVSRGPPSPGDTGTSLSPTSTASRCSSARRRCTRSTGSASSSAAASRSGRSGRTATPGSRTGATRSASSSTSLPRRSPRAATRSSRSAASSRTTPGRSLPSPLASV